MGVKVWCKAIFEAEEAVCIAEEVNVVVAGILHARVVEHMWSVALLCPLPDPQT